MCVCVYVCLNPLGDGPVSCGTYMGSGALQWYGACIFFYSSDLVIQPPWPVPPFSHWCFSLVMEVSEVTMVKLQVERCLGEF